MKIVNCGGVKETIAMFEECEKIRKIQQRE
jgi:hypothetical protein